MLYTIKKARISYKLTSLLLCLTIFASSLLFYTNNKNLSYANIINLPLNQQLPTKIPTITSKAISLPVMRGIKIDPKKPFSLQFHFDTMSESNIKQKDMSRLIKYFLGFLTIPEDQLWVNLSPNEKDKIIPESLAALDIGKDLLLEDYLLKQLTTSLTDPRTPSGKKFWKKVRKICYKYAKTTKIPINTFHKIWIVPETAVVCEHTTAVSKIKMTNQKYKNAPKPKTHNLKPIIKFFIKEARLKVLLEEDYILKSKTQTKNKKSLQPKTYNPKPNPFQKQINAEAKRIFKQDILPIIEKQINESVNFAPLRQLYYSLILAHYFKRKMKNHPIYRQYFDQNKTTVIAITHPQQTKKTIYNSYIKNFKQGIYNYIAAEYDPYLHKKIKRRYYSGGINNKNISETIEAELISDPQKDQSSFFRAFKGEDVASDVQFQIKSQTLGQSLSQISKRVSVYPDTLWWKTKTKESGRIIVKDKSTGLRYGLRLSKTNIDLSKKIKDDIFTAELPITNIAHKKIVQDILNAGRTQNLSFYPFDTLIQDLFGFALPNKKIIALHQSIFVKPIVSIPIMYSNSQYQKCDGQKKRDYLLLPCVLNANEQPLLDILISTNKKAFIVSLIEEYLLHTLDENGQPLLDIFISTNKKAITVVVNGKQTIMKLSNETINDFKAETWFQWEAKELNKKAYKYYLQRILHREIFKKKDAELYSEIQAAYSLAQSSPFFQLKAAKIQIDQPSLKQYVPPAQKPLVLRIASFISELIYYIPLGKLIPRQKEIIEEKTSFLTTLFCESESPAYKKTLQNILSKNVILFNSFTILFKNIPKSHWVFRLFTLGWMGILSFLTYYFLKTTIAESFPNMPNLNLYSLFQIVFFRYLHYLYLFSFVVRQGFVIYGENPIYTMNHSPSLSEIVTHECIHKLAEYQIIKKEHPLAAAFGELMQYRDHGRQTAEFTKGRILFRKYPNPKKRPSVIHELKWLKKMRDNNPCPISHEPFWSYPLGALFAGIAQALSDKTGNPDDAWQYLKLIAHGTGMAKAELFLLNKKTRAESQKIETDKTPTAILPIKADKNPITITPKNDVGGINFQNIKNAFNSSPLPFEQTPPTTQNILGISFIILNVEKKIKLFKKIQSRHNV